MKKSKEQIIDFLIFDWKDVESMILAIIKYANKGYFCQPVESDDDNYFIAYSKEKITKVKAQKAFEKMMEEDTIA